VSLKESFKEQVLARLMPATRLERQPGPLPEFLNEWTLLAEDRGASASDELLDLAAELIAATRQVPLDRMGGRAPDATFDLWPGEHYRLLTAIGDVLAPSLAIDIGTATGYSALTFLRSPKVGRVTTIDIVPWRSADFGGPTGLRDDDFGPRLRQVVTDLADATAFAAHADELAEADVVFVDGPKDGIFEQRFMPHFLARPPRQRQLVVIDDIRVLTMVKLWRQLPNPRLDLTSFGHFSGTGLLLRSP
jgi:predicted O-methyltransferase YrrM